MRSTVVEEVGADWSRLSPLPDVHARYRDEYSFEALRDHYEALPKEPLLVRGELFEPVIPAEPRDGGGALHLDSLLGTSVLNAHPKAPVFSKGFPAVAPLPLELAWASPEGRPLWTCSELRAQGDALRAPFFWHKRYPEDRAHLSKKGKLPNTRSGRWKEYRMPLSGVVTPEFRATCIGNAEEVARLLSYITHVGKKTGYGFGRVSWSVEVLDTDIETIRGVSLRCRSVPVKYLMETEGEARLTPEACSRRSWTSPSWFGPWWELCTVRA